MSGADHPLLYSVEGARRQLGDISRAQVYKLLQSGALRSVKDGRRRLVPRAALVDYLAQLEAASH